MIYETRGGKTWIRLANPTSWPEKFNLLIITKQVFFFMDQFFHQILKWWFFFSSSTGFAIQYEDWRRKSVCTIQDTPTTPALGQRWRTRVWTHDWWRTISNGGVKNGGNIMCDKLKCCVLSSNQYWITVHTLQMHIVHIKEGYNSLSEAVRDRTGVAVLGFFFQVILFCYFGIKVGNNFNNYLLGD